MYNTTTKKNRKNTRIETGEEKIATIPLKKTYGMSII